MGKRSAMPLAIAILGLLMSVLSYAMKDVNFGNVVYGCGLLSAGFSLIHWFKTPKLGRG